MASDDDEAYEDTAADEDDRDEDYVANDGDDGGDDDDDDDGDASEEAPHRRRAAPAPRTRRSTRNTKSYKDESDDEEEADDDDEEEEPDDEDDDDDDDDDDEPDDEEEDYAPRGRRSRAAAPAARPRRQAAQQANARLKHQDTPEDDDEEIARAIDREINGLRARPRKAAATTAFEERAVSPRSGGRRGGSVSRQSSAPPAASTRAGGSSGGRRAPPCRTSQRTVAKVSYAESDDDDDEEGGGRAGGGRGGGGGRAKEALSAFEDPDEDDVEDEIDKVLGHRESETLSPVPGDPWASRELYIKWKRYSYIHCSWDTRAALEHLRGFKRVLIYTKKVDDVEAGRRYFSREEQEMQDVEREMEAQLNQQHMQVERVVAEKPATVFAPASGEEAEGEGRGSVGPPGQRRREREAADAEMVTVTKYLVKWEGLPYAECTWETVEDVIKAGGSAQIDQYLLREQRLLEPGRSVDATRKQFKIKGTRALEQQPDYLKGGQLRDYQLESLNWMIYSWSEDRNIVLADEMGLGKTVQCVSFVGYLAETLQIRGPFLVVVPLSTVPNWIREFRRWVPFVNAVVYVGDSRSREVLRAYECDPAPHHRSSRPHKFEVLLTTYELILKDAPILSRIKWAYLLVDEAHRLKNAESALYQELMEWHFKNKLLVTGTPLQNSLKELWALLHFLDPAKFPTCERFEAEYSLETADSVSGLHGVLRPHLLRRVIKDVEKSLPPKNERILRVDMTPLQKQYYKWCLTRNFKELNKSSRGCGHVSLLNIIGELKKCCNHPFLFESAEEDYRGSENDKSAVDRLIVTSGKMVLLDKLLRRLKQTGHRVLVFSQMVRVLDIISDYMRLRGYPHQRLDGSTPAASRHAAMEHFNRPDSPDFAFLLSTRAGGLGINLATADTVIIFDSDWNPQNDLQAMSRAHRIGQTETVNIYRFVTSSSVEEDILERAKRKMVLDHLVIQRMDTSGRTILDPAAGKAGASAKQMFGKDELAAILRFGAEDLFKQQPEDDGNAAERACSALYEDDIDLILERAEVVDTRALAAAGADESAAAAAELLSSFNVATFKNEEDDAAFWSKLIPPSERPKEEEEDLLPRAARRMLDQNAADSEDEGPGGSGNAGAAGGAQRKAGGRGSRGGRAGTGGGGRSRPGASSGAEPGPPVDGAALRVDEWMVEVDEEGLPVIKDDGTEPECRSLSRRDAAAFVRAIRRYGRVERLADVASEVGRSLEDASPAQRLSLWHSLMDGCKVAVQKTTEEQAEDAKDAILDFFGVSVKAAELLAVCSHLRLLSRKVDACRDPAAVNFRLDAASQLSVPKWGKAINWTSRDDALLLLGVHLYGMGHWDQVAADEALRPVLGDKLAGAVGGAAAAREEAGAGGGAGGQKEALPKASHLETRALGLLRKMHASHKVATAPPAKRQAGGGGAARKKAAAVAAAPTPPLPQQPSWPPQVAPQAQHDRERDSRTDAAAAVAAAAREPPPPVAASAATAAATTVTNAGGREGAPAPSANGGGAGGGGGRKRKAGAAAAGGGHEPVAQAEKRVRVDSKAAAAAAESKAAADGPVGRDELKALLDPAMADIRKLRKLQDGSITDKSAVVQNTKLFLTAIGAHVEQVAAAKGGKVGKRLWDLAARNIGNGKSGEELRQLHQRIQQSQPPGQQKQPQSAKGQSAKGQGSKAQGQPFRSQPQAKAAKEEQPHPPPRVQSPRPQVVAGAGSAASAPAGLKPHPLVAPGPLAAPPPQAPALSPRQLAVVAPSSTGPPTPSDAGPPPGAAAAPTQHPPPYPPQHHQHHHQFHSHDHHHQHLQQQHPHHAGVARPYPPPVPPPPAPPPGPYPLPTSPRPPAVPPPLPPPMPPPIPPPMPPAGAPPDHYYEQQLPQYPPQQPQHHHQYPYPHGEPPPQPWAPPPPSAPAPPPPPMPPAAPPPAPLPHPPDDPPGPAPSTRPAAVEGPPGLGGSSDWRTASTSPPARLYSGQVSPSGAPAGPGGGGSGAGSLYGTTEDAEPRLKRGSSSQQLSGEADPRLDRRDSHNHNHSHNQHPNEHDHHRDRDPRDGRGGGSGVGAGDAAGHVDRAGSAGADDRERGSRERREWPGGGGGRERRSPPRRSLSRERDREGRPREQDRDRDARERRDPRDRSDRGDYDARDRRDPRDSREYDRHRDRDRDRDYDRDYDRDHDRDRDRGRSRSAHPYPHPYPEDRPRDADRGREWARDRDRDRDRDADRDARDRRDRSRDRRYRSRSGSRDRREARDREYDRRRDAWEHERGPGRDRRVPAGPRSRSASRDRRGDRADGRDERSSGRGGGGGCGGAGALGRQESMGAGASLEGVGRAPYTTFESAAQ